MGIENKPEIEFSMSMGSLLRRSTLWSTIVPVDYYARLAKEAGYDAIEYWPIRPMPSLQVRTGALSQSARKAISSAHQSYRSETSLRQAWNHEARVLAMQSYLLLPNIRNSTQHLEKLQTMLGNMPVVMFPHHEGVDIKKFPNATSPLVRDGEPEYENFYRLQNKLTETAPELLDRWGVTPENFGQEAVKRGYAGICIDTEHLRAFAQQGFSTNFGNWREMLPYALPYTKEVHINPNNSEELEAIINEDHRSEVVELLQDISNSGWTGLVTTEVKSDLIAQRTEVKLLTPQQLTEGHKPVVEAVRNIFG